DSTDGCQQQRHRPCPLGQHLHGVCHAPETKVGPALAATRLHEIREGSFQSGNFPPHLCPQLNCEKWISFEATHHARVWHKYRGRCFTFVALQARRIVDFYDAYHQKGTIADEHKLANRADIAEESCCERPIDRANAKRRSDV